MALDTISEKDSHSSHAHENPSSPSTPPPPQHRYDFRPNARRMKRPMSTWIDTDDSGTYDPKRNGNATLPQKQARGSLSDANKEVKNKRVRGLRSGARLQRGKQEELPFVESVGKEKAGNLENTNETAYQAKEYKTLYKRFRNRAEVKTLPNDDLNGVESYSIRARRRPSVESAKSLSSASSEGIPPLDLFGLPATLPESKGCKTCLNLKISCPLEKDKSTYPCYICVENDCECRLIIPPLKKLACEGCCEARKRCSYRDGSNPSLPCENCEKRKQKCIPCQKRSSGFKPTLERPFLSCKQCREKKRQCSLKTKKTGFPCTNCLEGVLECSFQELGNKEVKSLTLKEVQKIRISDASKEWTAEELQEIFTLNATKEGTVKKIKTCLAHPITFNHTPSKDGNDPCHWCDTAAFGIVGNEELEVTVIDWHDGRGYTEVSGGYVGKGLEPSRMCQVCTMERIMVSTCEDHAIHPLPGRNAKTFEFGTALDKLLSETNPPNGNRPLWCSICPSPAFFECLTPQILDLADSRNGTAPTTLSGCGLLLCESCERLLTNRYRGRLASLISDAITSTAPDFPAGLRPDVSFLLSDGELMRRMRAAEAEKEKEG
jgi:Fungal Zn(2)-Cys(6) binuclear cluster domain